MAESKPQVAIAVAVISVVGSLGAALLGNWDKIFTSSSTNVSSIAAGSAAPSAAPPNITGEWRDVSYPGNSTRYAQDGHVIRFARRAALPNGLPYESSGSGTINGTNVNTTYTARYQNGMTSTGGCSGSVAPDARHMELACTDSLFGPFSGNTIRQ